MNKKASVQDVGWAMIFFFVAVVMFLVVTYGFNQVVDKMKITPQINSSLVTVNALDDSADLTYRYDYVSIAILLGFTIAIIITGWLVPVSSIFMWLYFIFLAVLVMASAIFSYVWNKIYTTTVLAATIDSHFPIANHILSNFPIYITIIGFLGMIVMFAKPQGGQIE